MGGQHNYRVDHNKKDMRYLFSDWERIEKIIKGKFVYLFLDYDGTLAPIALTPGMAVMPEEAKDMLRQLSKMSNHKIAIISGRALKDISRRIGLKNIVYAGNHGFEIKGPKVSFKSPVPFLYKKTLKEIKGKLEKSLSSINGVLVENKGFSLSVHYRLADMENIPAIKVRFYTVIFPYEFTNNVQVKPGKMVLEVKPPTSWDKGKVVLWLLARCKLAIRTKKREVLPIYIGDDKTDEDAFGSLKGSAITIFVGRPKKTKARFYLKDPEEVAIFLTRLLKILDKGAA